MGDPNAWGDSAGPSQVPGGGREREACAEAGRRKPPSPGKQCVPPRKHTAPHADAGGRSSRRAGERERAQGGAEPPPSGPVVASQTARAPGVTAAQRRVSPQELGLCSEGRREEEGGFAQTGRVSLRKKKKKEKDAVD